MKKLIEFIKRLGITSWLFLVAGIYLLVVHGVPSIGMELVGVIFIFVFFQSNATVLWNMIRGK